MVSKLVGVLGGTGPAATAYFLKRLVDLTDAQRDQDHVRAIVHNDTATPDRTDFILGKSEVSPLPYLVEDARLLEKCGCDFLAIPCNTAHCLFDQVAEAVGIPIIHMIDQTMVHCCECGFSRVGVLATEGTVATDMFGAAGAAAGVEVAYPGREGQLEVDRIIYDAVKAGRPVAPAELGPLAAMMAEAHCDAIILGCTELSAAFGEDRSASALPVVDPLDVLVVRTIEEAGAAVRPGALA